MNQAIMLPKGNTGWRNFEGSCDRLLENDLHHGEFFPSTVEDVLAATCSQCYCI